MKDLTARGVHIFRTVAACTLAFCLGVWIPASRLLAGKSPDRIEPTAQDALLANIELFASLLLVACMCNLLAHKRYLAGFLAVLPLLGANLLFGGSINMMCYSEWVPPLQRSAHLTKCTHESMWLFASTLLLLGICWLAEKVKPLIIRVCRKLIAR